MEKRAFLKVTVDGNDITAKLRPLLQNLSVSDKAGTTSDTCQITVDDRGGQIALPSTGAELSVTLGWTGGPIAQVFVGKVDSVKSSGTKGGGRTLDISAKGLDTNSKAKEPREKHHDKGKLPDVLKKFGADVGIADIKVDADFEGIERDYWNQDGESFIGFGQRIADEIGGTFRVRSGKAVMAKRGSGRSPGGQTLPTVLATYGSTLHSWDIAPEINRPRHKKVKARYYDRKAAKYVEVEAEVEDEGAVATHSRRHTVADKDEGKTANDSDKSAAESNKGGGSVTIEGDVTAHPEGNCVLSGTRPGIDGTYRIDGVTHKVDKGGGFTTSLELKKPGGDAGKDKRKKKGK